MTEQKSSYTYEDLIASGNGELFGEGNARLPAPPMLMFDRIADINAEGGEFGKGVVVAELDIKPDLWFFDCHFKTDPVMPGCLGLDAMWQLVGFYMTWSGISGFGRALGSGLVKFTGQVMPDAKLVTYRIEMKRIINGRLKMGIANAIMEVDGKQIYKAEDLKVGIFNRDEIG